MKTQFFAIPLFAFLTGCVSGEISAADYIDADNDSEDSIPSPSSDLDDEDEDTPIDTSSPAEDYAAFYDFSDQQSLLYVQVFKDESAWGSGFAHNHVIRASNWTGSLFFDPSDLSSCELEFSLDVDELMVDEDTMRDVVGYNDTISTNDRSQIREHMLADNQLNANQYPEITFESVECQGTTGAFEGDLQVIGGLEIAGTAATTTINLDFKIRSSGFYASGGFEMNHSDFGLEPYSAFAGAVRNAEQLVFAFDMLGTPN
ncbi:MAG: YceI family protein [Myxococcota bacterium]|nr:YceI family protein [Myxococcota bacterium]